jgi:ketosteroid isomerase-like protein
MPRVAALKSVVFAAVLAVLGGSPLLAQSHAAAEQEVRNLITQFTTAYGVNDLDKYFSYYADDMTWWGPNGSRNEADGKTPKANYQKSWPESVARSGGLAGSKVSDLRVQVSPQGDAAIASYRLDVVRKNPAPDATPPRPANIAYEMTAALFKRGNDWKIVHFHYQTIPPPRPGTQD